MKPIGQLISRSMMIKINTVRFSRFIYGYYRGNIGPIYRLEKAVVDSLPPDIQMRSI